MRKIPVGQTIAFAYAFVFGNIGAIIAVAWFPAVLTGVAGYLARLYAVSHRAELEAGEPGVAGISFIVSLATLLVMTLASSIVAVGVTRQVLGLGSGGAPVRFPSDATEWRMFASNLRYLAGAGVLIVFAAAIMMAAFLLAGAPLDAPEQAEPTAAVFLAAMLSWAVFAYAFAAILRMGFMLPAIVVAEENGSLRRAHGLTKANFWRAFAIMAALGLPVFILLVAGELALLRSSLGPEAGSIPPAEFMQRISDAIQLNAIPWQIFTAVLFVLASGLIYSGTAFAYRALVPPGSEPREQDRANL